MNPRKLFTITLLILALGIGYYSMNSAPVLSDENYSYHGDTAWQTDVNESLDTAAEEEKPVLVYFWTTWCTYCEDYNNNAYTDQQIIDRLDEFVLLAVNLDDGSPAAKELQQEYNANYPPQHVAITPDGEVLVEINGYAETDAFATYLDEARAEWEDR
ncbi:thioredoxin family protein [Natronomonas amylolytica]|uniref:thioredoxin family protein n=1 Tax=Natronomonas amylolytica TaxID=3108498 RepID=UPI0030096975